MPDESNIDAAMAALPFAHRYRWCEGGPCGCMGCANRAAGFDKAAWTRWLVAHVHELLTAYEVGQHQQKATVNRKKEP